MIPIPLLEQPFKDREEVKAEIGKCDLMASILSIAALVFAALGVISDGFDIPLGLEPMIWLLLAIVAGLGAIMPHMKSTVAKHLYGIESEIKKQE